jgi:tryptophan-rich sensory protein
MMGISAFLIWQKGLNIHTVKIALLFFIIQLLLNAIWTPLFFGLKSPTLAFADIILLWFAIVVTMVKFYSISKPASFLLIPYLLWVTFASVLNFSIVLLNR